MKTFPNYLKTIVAMFACAVCFSANSPMAQAQFAPVMQECPSWTIEFLGKAYDRPQDDLGLPLVIDTVTNQVLLTSDQATDANTAPGAEVKFNFVNRRSGIQWEVRSYFVGFDQVQEIVGSDLFSPLFPTITPDSISTRYKSDIYSIGLNAKRSIRPGVTCLFGPRFVSLSEQFTASFDQVVATPGGPFTVVGQQTNETRNSMIGLQTGVEFNFPLSQSIFIQGFGRFGGYLNPTNLTTTVSNNITANPTVTRFDKSTGTFIGEVGGRIYANIIPNAFSSFIGYEATWIDGVALAPAQFITVNPPSIIQTTNTLFYHAISFGFAYQY